MIARAFVAESAVDQNKIRRWTDISNPTGRRHADEQLATGGEELFGHEYGEGGADGTANDADLPDAFKFERQKLGVVASPALMNMAKACSLQMADDIAVRVKNADIRHRQDRKPLLPTRLPQKRFRPEHGGSAVVLAAEDRPGSISASRVLFIRLQCFAGGLRAHATTSRPAAFHSGKPSSSLRTL